MRGAVWLVEALLFAVTQISLSALASTNEPMYEEWSDVLRSRLIPVRFYLPQMDDKVHPVVIFSHGLGGSRDAAVYLGRYWSQHGYICIFVQHPGSDTSVWKSVAEQDQGALVARMNGAANGEQLVSRVQDIKFVIDQLPAANQSDRYLKGKMDLSKIGMAGHSFGAGTTLAVAGQSFGRFSAADARVKVAIPLSPPVNLRGREPGTVFGSIKIPCFVMTGTEDNAVIGRTRKEDRRKAFDGMNGPDKYLVILRGGDHMIFNGATRRSPKPNDKLQMEEIEKLTTAFLDAYLKGDERSRSWLQKDAKAYLGNTASCELK